jgi:hypothetical protein
LGFGSVILSVEVGFGYGFPIILESSSTILSPFNNQKAALVNSVGSFKALPKLLYPFSSRARIKLANSSLSSLVKSISCPPIELKLPITLRILLEKLLYYSL